MRLLNLVAVFTLCALANSQQFGLHSARSFQRRRGPGVPPFRNSRPRHKNFQTVPNGVRLPTVGSSSFNRPRLSTPGARQPPAPEKVSPFSWNPLQKTIPLTVPQNIPIPTNKKPMVEVVPAPQRPSQEPSEEVSAVAGEDVEVVTETTAVVVEEPTQPPAAEITPVVVREPTQPPASNKAEGDGDCLLGTCKTIDNCPNPRTENYNLFNQVCMADGTEYPYTGKHLESHGKGGGVYKCSCCGHELFHSDTKFESYTGWPSFWDPISDDSVDYKVDYKLGYPRIEIVCKKCGAHLGHVFPDGPEPTGQRYCLNSVCLDFEPDNTTTSNLLTRSDPENQARVMGDGDYTTSTALAVPVPAKETGIRTAVLAGGCFWGVEAVYEHLEGVSNVVSGYAGGRAETAHYKIVTTGTTDHAEAVEITYDADVISFETLLEVLVTVVVDPTTLNFAMPDYGRWYRSAIFYVDDTQKSIAEDFIQRLEEEGRFENPIVTEVVPLIAFYDAEDYHQDFAYLNPSHPYIVQWDTPKIAALEDEFPDIFNPEPATSANDPDEQDFSWLNALLSREQGLGSNGNYFLGSSSSGGGRGVSARGG